MGRSLFGMKKDRKRGSLVNMPDVLVTGEAADVAQLLGHFLGPILVIFLVGFGTQECLKTL